MFFSESVFIEQEDGALVEWNYEIQFFDDANTADSPNSQNTIYGNNVCPSPANKIIHTD